MPLALSILALLLALVGVFLPAPESPDEKPSWASVLLAALFGVVAIVAVKFLPGADPTAPTNPWLAVLWGAGGALLVGLFSAWRPLHAVVPLGIAVGSYLITKDFTGLQIPAFLLGGAVVSLALGINSSGYFVLAAGAMAAATSFNTSQLATAPAAPVVGAFVVFAAFIGACTGRWPRIAAVAVTVLVAAGLFTASVADGKGGTGVWIGALAAPIGGLAVWFLYKDEQKRTILVLFVSTMIWLALATVGFSIGKSAGMALALLAGAALPMILGKPKAVATVAPLATLVWYRLVSQSDAVLARSSDLSSFYLAIGLAAGAALCALVLEWRGRVGGMRGTAGGGIWGLVASAAALVTQAIFGAKGLSGLVVGSGLGSMMGRPDQRPMSGVMTCSVVAGAAALLIEFGDKLTPEDHIGKIKFFAVVAVGILVVAGLLYALQGEKKEEVKA